MLEASFLSSTSCVEDNLRNLSVLDTGSIIVARGVAELEGDLASIVAVHGHLPQPLGPIVTVQPLQGADRRVVGIGLNLQGLLEHRSEGRVGSVTGEGDFIGS